jgi:hypothetical protein
MRASSWNQISIVSTSTAFSRSSRRVWTSFFAILNSARSLGVVAGPGRKLAIAHSPQLERQLLERLARDGQLIDYHHTGYWKPMDSLREKCEVETLRRCLLGSVGNIPRAVTG